eukprot:1366030-Pleurochrysis_carterae.AAC.5
MRRLRRAAAGDTEVVGALSMAKRYATKNSAKEKSTHVCKEREGDAREVWSRQSKVSRRAVKNACARSVRAATRCVWQG